MKTEIKLKDLDRVAKNMGLRRGNGSYNGGVYWVNAIGHIYTRYALIAAHYCLETEEV